MCWVLTEVDEALDMGQSALWGLVVFLPAYACGSSIVIVNLYSASS